MKMRSQDNDRLGIMFRYQDIENYYRFSWHGQSQVPQTRKRVGGVLKTLAEDSAAYTVEQTYALQIVAQGSSIKVLIDGKTIFSVTDTSFPMEPSHYIPLRMQAARSMMSSSKSYPLATFLLSDNFNDRDHGVDHRR
jgi:hypothetical protein